MKPSIGIIGCGNMGSALVLGLRKAGYPVLAYDADPKKRRAVRRLGARIAESNGDLARKTRSIFLAVKPQQMDGVLKELRPRLHAFSLLVSIAAGISTRWIERRVGNGIHVVRVMPNMPAQQGKGMSVVCAGSRASSRDLVAVKKWFSTVGAVETVPEKWMDAVTAVSGSGPAYFFFLIEQMSQAGRELGLPRAQALTLAVRTAEGAARMALTGVDPAVLRAAVTSKGGTTEAAFRLFEKRGFGKIIREGVQAAARRSKEISRKCS